MREVMNKKGGVPISVVLLVVATLILVITALFIFNTRVNNIDKEIKSSVFLEDIYSTEIELDFVVEQVFDYCVESFVSEEEFGNCFRERLGLFKLSGEYVIKELGQLEGQVDGGVVFGDEVLKGNFEFVIDREFENSFEVEYKYEKEFSRDV
jgi:hypothetical protein